MISIDIHTERDCIEPTCNQPKTYKKHHRQSKTIIKRESFKLLCICVCPGEYTKIKRERERKTEATTTTEKKIHERCTVSDEPDARTYCRLCHNLGSLQNIHCNRIQSQLLIIYYVPIPVHL